jgi:dihydrofolate synthase/folylpolyglutamate synthase
MDREKPGELEIISKKSADFFNYLESRLISLSSPGVRPGLKRISRLLASLGNPHLGIPAIHVVGTNGKGSTAASLSAIFSASGYKTALYTSPHLIHMGERLRINERLVAEEKWSDHFNRLDAALKQDEKLRSDPPTLFELITALSLSITAEEMPDIAIVEAGLGGRLDATNLINPVAMSVITSIAMDHESFLGDTIFKIGEEKFAVLRPHGKAFFSGEPEGLVPLFKVLCKKLNVSGHMLSEDWRVENVRSSYNGNEYDLVGPDVKLTGLATHLLGLHQVKNTALAASSAWELKDQFANVTEKSIREGLHNAKWPGRLEWVNENPPLLLDGAHNPHGMASLVKSLKVLFTEKAQFVILFAVMRDKDYRTLLAMLSELNPKSLVLTAVPSLERSAKPEELLRMAKGVFRRNSQIEAYDDAEEAYHRARRFGLPVLCCGSLYFVGWLKSYLERVHHGNGRLSA